MFRIVSTWQVAKGTSNLVFGSATHAQGIQGEGFFLLQRRNTSEQEQKAFVQKKNSS